MNDSSVPDTPRDVVYVSATCEFPRRDPVLERARSHASSVREWQGGVTVLGFSTPRIEMNSSTDRQVAFVMANDELLSVLSVAGLDRESVASANATLSLHISLLPDSGQAGVELGRSLVDKWAELGTRILLDAYNPSVGDE